MIRSTICAGIPSNNSALYHRVPFAVGDPVVLMEINGQDGSSQSICLVRDVELDRAKDNVTADLIATPADYTPQRGLSPDREIATAQAAAECLLQNGVKQVVADRSLPLSFAHVIQEAGIELICDLEMGVKERRQKSAVEIEHLKQAQAVTESAVQLACELIANAVADKEGNLYHDQSPLTSERVHSAVNIYLMEQGFSGPKFIVAGGPQGACCHHHGDGQLRTGQPVIVDIYPTNGATHYCGDCTRTVVHGDIPDEVAQMHEAVRTAKAAACETVRAGVLGADVHAATKQVLLDKGYQIGFPPEGAESSFCTMHHGTGHGIGLDVHEPPLLDDKGVELLIGDALTIEPGLYRKDLGGVRVEDLVIVTAEGHINLNQLPEGLVWK